MVVGISWIDDTFITVKSIIEKVALSPLRFIDSTAFIPSGVAAPPAPKRLAEKFIAIYFLVSSDSLGKNFLVMGERIFAIFCDKPDFSIRAIIPDHKTYTAKSEIARLSALSPPDKSDDKISSG